MTIQTAAMVKAALDSTMDRYAYDPYWMALVVTAKHSRNPTVRSALDSLEVAVQLADEETSVHELVMREMYRDFRHMRRSRHTGWHKFKRMALAFILKRFR